MELGCVRVLTRLLFIRILLLTTSNFYLIRLMLCW